MTIRFLNRCIFLTLIQDRKAVGNFEPAVDYENNVELLSAMQSGRHTVVKFRRPIKAMDNQDSTIRVIQTLLEFI